MPEQKALSGVTVKDASQGRVEAVFSTFNVIDSDRDVTVPGAFQDGQSVKISAYGHTSWAGAPPVGRGTIRQNEKEAILDGQFFMDTQAGRETFLTVKELGDLQEWSYGYDILESELGQFNGEDVQFLKELSVIEVSPVLVAAGVDTRTLAAKASKQALAPHTTEISDATWDGPGNKANLRNDGSQSYYRAAFAWQDPDAEAETKSAYKFIHHEVSSGGDVGAANLVACSAGIGVLNGGRTGTTIPDSDRQGVYNHLAKHLRDGGRTPPELAAKASDLSLPDRTLKLLGEFEALLGHARYLGGGDVAQKEGRVLSSANHGRLTALAGTLDEAHKTLLSLLAETDPNKAQKALEREFLAFQRHLTHP